MKSSIYGLIVCLCLTGLLLLSDFIARRTGLDVLKNGIDDTLLLIFICVILIVSIYISYAGKQQFKLTSLVLRLIIEAVFLVGMITFISLNYSCYSGLGCT